ncbi:N-acetyldiaminopimelate deacetylase [Mycobacteroides abscessus subsp. abscessus]|nr:N-acetyldiaminopimelate deacetylase [Mycobacteroides abscessus subsp. abscessus]
MDFLRTGTEAEVIECKEAMTGEDFGYMLSEIPGFMFWLGADSEFGLHHSRLQPKEEAIEKAISYMTALQPDKHLPGLLQLLLFFSI